MKLTRKKPVGGALTGRATRRSIAELPAIVSHIPGMVFQVFRDHDGTVSIPYVSEKSRMVLGVEAEALSANPALFSDLVLPEDRPSYLEALAHAGGAHLAFNWEGRIWVEEWNDVKWVSSRVSQRKLANGTLWDGIMLNITHSKETEHAIISHIPGMAFQVFRGNDGAVSMPYVSEKSRMLLGIEPLALSANPALFLDLVQPEDRASYLEALAQVGGAHLTFNWEGRVRVEEWNDVKWVSSRVSQRKLANGTLWDGIMLNVTHSKAAEAEIKRSREELSALTSHMHAVKEQERLHIAREIHDELGGYLTAIKIGLAWLSNNLPAEASRQLERTAYLDTVVDRTIEAIHRIAANLRPPLVDFGIVPAIEWQARQFSQDFGIPCEFFSSEENISLEPGASITVFRIAQEALTNVAKHARATKSSVRITRQGNLLCLEVADNGMGLPAAGLAEEKRSFGMLGMSERAAALGGVLSIRSAAGEGTTLTLHLPIAPGAIDASAAGLAASQE